MKSSIQQRSAFFFGIGRRWASVSGRNEQELALVVACVHGRKIFENAPLSRAIPMQQTFPTDDASFGFNRTRCKRYSHIVLAR